MYDYLIVGAGLFGAVCARQLTDAGLKVLVVENLISTRAEALVERLLATPVTNGAVIELTRRINQLKLLPGNEFVLVSVRMDEQKAGGIQKVGE